MHLDIKSSNVSVVAWAVVQGVEAVTASTQASVGEQQLQHVHAWLKHVLSQHQAFQSCSLALRPATTKRSTAVPRRSVGSADRHGHGQGKHSRAAELPSFVSHMQRSLLLLLLLGRT